MKLQLQNPLFVVADMECSKNFYKTVLGLEPVSDFGANVVLEGGLALQTLDSWAGFLGKTPEEIAFGGNNSEVYFETGDFDGFLRQLFERPSVELRAMQRTVLPPSSCTTSAVTVPCLPSRRTAS